MSNEANNAQIAKKWDNVGRVGRTNWWQSPLIRRHINERVAGRACGPKVNEGSLQLLLQRSAGRKFRRGVSVGCGAGQKEMALVEAGLVESFELFELSTKRIEAGRELAAQRGLSNRVTFRSDDAFSAVPAGSVDFVHWNNSLHHMFDVDAAVAWSRRVLETGGLFFMDDFVGPNRRQWSDKALALGSKVRALLPERYLLHPVSGKVLPRKLQRESAEKIAAQDPSEAVDAERILSAVRKHFPEAEIKLTGGSIYHGTLSAILANFDEEKEEDRVLLELLLLIDDLSTEFAGIETHYAVAIAWKREASKLKSIKRKLFG